MYYIDQRETPLLQPAAEVHKLKQVQPGCSPAKALLHKPVSVLFQVIAERPTTEPLDGLRFIKETMQRSPLE
ncbi:MAG: hypothetical protein ABSG62_17730 [Terracidiphilus sp.]